MNELTFLDLFSGIGGFRLGMEMAGHRCIGHCEIDKYANMSYRAMHDVKENEFYANDIRTVRTSDLPKADVWCFGFPCQDISIAGKTLGFAGQRSSLFFTVTRLVADLEEKNRPKYLFIENVKNLLSVNRGYDFARLLVEMDEIGYDAEWQVLNSKHFGVPQNRERVFIIGHIRGRGGRKVFPITETDGRVGNEIIRLGNSKYFTRVLQTYDTSGSCGALDTMQGGNRQPCVKVKTAKVCIDKSSCNSKIIDTANCITAREDRGISNRKAEGTAVVCIGNINPSGNGMNGNVFDSDGLAPTLTTNKGEGNKIAVKCLNTKDSEGKQPSQQARVYDTSGLMTALTSEQNGRFNIAIPVLTPERAEKRQNGRRFKTNGKPMFTLTSQDRHGVVVADGIYTQTSDRFQRGALKGTSRCLKANNHDAGVKIYQSPRGKNKGGLKDIVPTITKNSFEHNNHLLQNCRIRKLTPKECFRLQGFPDEYFERAEAVNSNSQLYKQAGNSVTVNVIYEIAKIL